MIPITCIASYCIPDGLYPYRKKPERYALDLEEDLFDYFKDHNIYFISPENYDTGKRRKAGPYGFFLIYVSYKVVVRV